MTDEDLDLLSRAEILERLNSLEKLCSSFDDRLLALEKEGAAPALRVPENQPKYRVERVTPGAEKEEPSKT